MKLPKLISGQMNVLYIICKPGFAEGSRHPKKRLEKRIEKPIVTKMRKNERLIA